MAVKDSKLALVEELDSMSGDPLAFVLFAFPWGVGELKGHDGPDVWQVELLCKIRDGLMTVSQALKFAVASGHGIGKAQPKDLLVDTPFGRVRWGDLCPGAFVFGLDGKPTQIVAIHEQGLKQTFLVSFDDGSSTVCCGEHVWKVRGRAERRIDRVGGRNGAWREMTTDELLSVGVTRKNGVAMARQWEIPQHEAVEFVNSDPIPVDPYLVGLWLGDGGRNKGSITNIDPDIKAQLDCRGIRYHIGTKTGTEAETISIYGLKVVLRRLGILHKYSYEKSIPDVCKYSTSLERAEVLRGLLDTDGEAAQHGSIVFSSTSRQLAEDVVWLARSLGGKARISPTVKMPFYNGPNAEKLPGRPCYRAVLTMPHDFQSFYVQRKQERVHNVQDRYLTRWITAIQPFKIEECMCITVDAPDGLYLTNDFIVTHNSAFVSWIILWALSTREDTVGVVTANTETQLKTKTWAQLSKWYQMFIGKHMFTLTATAIYSVDPEHEKTWRFDMIPWSEKNTEAFAGLHNAGKRLVVIFDEASSIVDKIWEVTEGAMTDIDTEMLWFAFGNPTMATGRFKECWGRFRSRWATISVDSRSSRLTNKVQIQEWIDDYGIDSDFVKVRVRGMFPNMSVKQFISVTDADAGFGKSLRPEQYQFAPKILTCDPAWEGDDTLEIGLRQGLAFSLLRSIPKNDNDIEIANILAHYEDSEQADAVFVDAGYGTGIVSAGQVMHRNWNLVWFSAASPDPGCLNMRSYMWKELRNWLKEGGAYPKDQTLYQDLIGPETVPRLDGKIQLESKKDMKKRGIPSPNKGDCLALSFAFPVSPKFKPKGTKEYGSESSEEDWSPFDYL